MIPQTIPSLSSRTRRGFSFTEILFAVMILGIGFIMVAAMFPVAIRQTQAVAEDTMAGAVGREGATYMGRIGLPMYHPPDAANYPLPADANGFYQWNMPPTYGIVYNFSGTQLSADPAMGGKVWPQPAAPAPPYYIKDFWTTMAGNLILPTDSRYAYIPFYKRDVSPAVMSFDTNPPVVLQPEQPSQYAQVTVIVVQCRNSAAFTYSDLKPPVGGGVPNLQGREVYARIRPPVPPAVADTIEFSSNPGSANSAIPAMAVDYTSCVAEGSYVVVSHDFQANMNKNPPYSYNGYLFRVGNPARNTGGSIVPNLWQLMPGNDSQALAKMGYSAPIVGDPNTDGWMRVYIVGRGYTDPTVGGGFSGPAMDVGAFTTFIKAQ